MLDERQLDCMVNDLMRFEVAATEAIRETCGARSPEAVTAAIRLHEATRETMRAALVYNEYEAVSAPSVEPSTVSDYLSNAEARTGCVRHGAQLAP